MSTIKIILRFFLLLVNISFLSCERSIPLNGGKDDFPSGTWQDLKFDKKIANSFSIFEPFLYVAALEDGVWRRNIAQLSAEWEYLGLVSRDSTRGTYRGSVVRVDAWGNDLLAGLDNPIEVPPEIKIGVWRSVDGGKTWAPSDSGMRTPTWQWSGVYDIRRSPQDPQIVMTGYGAFYRSSDGGLSWRFVYPDRREVITLFLKFSWNPANPLIVWALGQSGRGEPSLRHSTDGGLHWQLYHANRLIEQGVLKLVELAYDGGDPNIVYLATSAGVFKSTKGGQNWLDDQETLTPILTDSAERFFIGIVTQPKQPGVFFTAAARRFYLSIDGGQSNFIITSPNQQDIITLAYDERDNMLYISAKDGVFRLKDPLHAPRIPYR